MTILPQIGRLTTEEYQSLIDTGYFDEDERLELWEGQIHEMSPVGSRHSAVVKRLNGLFHRLFAGQYLIQIQDPIILSPRSQPQPDTALLRWREDMYAAQLPTPEDVVLLVEVSDSTLAYDLGYKTPRFARAGIPEVWVVDIASSSVTQFHTIVERLYQHQQSYQRNEELHTTLGVVIRVSEIVG